jgi:hypothetical protein
MDDMYVCPNEQCHKHDIYKQLYSCPVCKSPMKKVTNQEYMEISGNKERLKVRLAQDVAHNKNMLVSDQMTDADIKNLIEYDMMNLAINEVRARSMNTLDQTLGAGLQALIDQNKIIIRQNELILRALRQQPPRP